MSSQFMTRVTGFILGISVMMTMPARADRLKDEKAPTGK